VELFLLFLIRHFVLIKHTDRCVFSMQLLDKMYRPVFFTAQQPLVGQGLLIISFKITFRHTTLRRNLLDE